MRRSLTKQDARMVLVLGQFIIILFQYFLPMKAFSHVHGTSEHLKQGAGS